MFKILNRSTKQGDNVEAVRKALNNPETQRRIFDCFDLDPNEGLDRLFEMFPPKPLEKLKFDPDELSRRLPFERLAGSKQANPDELCIQEEQAVGVLSDAFRANTKTPALFWRAELWSGASFLAQSVAYGEGLGGDVTEVISIRPTSTELPFETELQELWDLIEPAQRGDEFGPSVLNWLNKTGRKLVINNAEFISHSIKRRSDLKISKLVRAIELAKWSDAPCILIIGKGDIAAQDDGALGLQLANALSVPMSDRYATFCFFLAWHSAERGCVDVNGGGTRRKRARWHYELIGDDQHVWPINIRVRAFFASNRENFSFFDPTQGFERLVGSIRRIPRSIAAYVADVLVYLSRVDVTADQKPGKRKTDRLLLRYHSTAKYWLTDDALKILRKVEPGLSTPSVGIAAVRNALHGDLKDVLREVEHAKNEHHSEPRYSRALSIGIKAIIQDEWAELSPLSRSVAHRRIAKRLFDNQNEKPLLGDEFPYEPHWGRSRIYFLAETIRHLVRTAEHIEPYQPTENDLQLREDFPGLPTAELEGCNPYHVWSYCFGYLFQKEINGNHGGPARRSLAKRHGCFELAVELLQLLSADQKIGKVHWALPPRLHNRFRLECAYALLDVGELDAAEEIFQELTTKIDPKSPRHGVENLLAISLIQTLRGDAASARQFQLRAQEMAGPLLDAASDLSRGRKDEIRWYLGTREAHLHLLEDNPCKAVHVLDKLSELSDKEASDDQESTKSLRGENAHNFIVACTQLAQSGDEDFSTFYEERALATCFEFKMASQSDGMSHEAMGYQIAMAGLIRDFMGYAHVSEKILDIVYDNIRQYGCSERTYLAFLIEAGSTLKAQRRLFRSYASYLRPCLRRAVTRDHFMEAKRAASVALEALTTLQGQTKELSKRKWNAEHKKCLTEESRFTLRDLPRRRPSYAARDPLYGFEMATDQFVLNSMRDFKFYDREIAWVKQVLDTPLGANLPLTQ